MTAKEVIDLASGWRSVLVLVLDWEEARTSFMGAVLVVVLCAMINSRGETTARRRASLPRKVSFPQCAMVVGSSDVKNAMNSLDLFSNKSYVNPTEECQ